MTLTVPAHAGHPVIWGSGLNNHGPLVHLRVTNSVDLVHIPDVGDKLVHSVRISRVIIYPGFIRMWMML